MLLANGEQVGREGHPSRGAVVGRGLEKLQGGLGYSIIYYAVPGVRMLKI